MFHVFLFAGLIVAMIAFWHRLGELRARIETLEMASAPTSWPVPEPCSDAQPSSAKARTAEDAAEWIAPLPPAAFLPTPPVAAPLSPEPAGSEPESVGPISSRPGFEELFGRRLPIWAGGITLAVAGALIVRFSIDVGLFPPIVRVLCGLLFGAGLIGGAEFAHRERDRVADPRVAQALSGAGIASLYGSILIAADLYHLVGPFMAFLGMAGVTAAAMGLALRFGPPSALLGLIGGLAAPALVGGGPANIPLLATYLALVVGGLCTLSRRQRWAWLGMSALVGGFGWGGVLIVGGALNDVATVSIGLYLLLLGLALPLLCMTGLRETQVRIASSLIAALEIAALIATGGFALLNWGLFGLVSIGIVWLSRRDTRLSVLPILGLAILLPLIATWPHPGAGPFAVVMIVGGLIYAGPALAGLWRDEGSIKGAGQIAALAFAGLVFSLLHFHRTGDGKDALFGGIALLCAAMPAASAMLGWRSEARHGDARFALLATSAAFLIAAAAILALPAWAVPTSVAAVALACLLLTATARDPRLEPGAWTLAGAAVLLLALDYRVLDEVARSCGITSDASDPAVSVARWAGLSAMLAACGWQGRQPAAKAIAQVLAVLTGYAALAQILPVSMLPLLPAAGLAGFAACNRTMPGNRLLPAATTCAGLSLLWAAGPLASWAAPAIRSLVGVPILVTSLPVRQDVLLKLLVPALAIAAAIPLSRCAREARIAAAVLASLLAGVSLHILYTYAVGIASRADFVRYGMAERTIWEGLLLGSAALLWQHYPRFRVLATGFGITAFAHSICYALLLHNPLWTEQATGGWPILNWLLPAYALPLCTLWVAGRALPDLAARHDRARSIAQMVLILMFGVSELRQLVHGDMLTSTGVTAAESVLRSVGAIGIAIGFLLWGIRRASHEWRIGSLVLMLAAVGKVFFIDAAGLDGLLRIASFVALGFSLIGIGWLYSRHLKADPLLMAHQ